MKPNQIQYNPVTTRYNSAKLGKNPVEVDFSTPWGFENGKTTKQNRNVGFFSTRTLEHQVTAMTGRRRRPASCSWSATRCWASRWPAWRWRRPATTWARTCWRCTDASGGRAAATRRPPPWPWPPPPSSCPAWRCCSSRRPPSSPPSRAGPTSTPSTTRSSPSPRRFCLSFFLSLFLSLHSPRP